MTRDEDASAAYPAASARLRVGLVVAWAVFWLLMVLVGVQDDVRDGGIELWHRGIVQSSSMLMASAIAVAEWRRIRRLDPFLARPLQWLVRAFRGLPLLAPAYAAVMDGVCHAACALMGGRHRHEPWGPLFLKESLKFTLYYLLFGGVLFGVRSYLAWSADRLRAERLQRLSQEALLLQLTQQLQPHFLFNALNTVSSLIHTNPDLADKLLTRLAALLRAATDVGRSPQQPLADELGLLKAYAAIMVERFADRVQLDWQIDETTLACQVPTLCLQPLLENCFRHAVERRRLRTHIVVRAERVLDRLRVEVEDDGGVLAGRAVFGVGLGNVQRRLQALHGDDALLTLEARAGGGVSAVVELPCAC